MSTPFDAITTTGTTAVAHKPAAVLPAGLVRAASERQLELLKSLMVEKCERTTGQISTADLASIDAWLASGPTRDQASEHITRLIGESKAARQQAPASDKVSEARSTGMPREDVVPAGRYAVATNDGAVNELAFYKVDRPTEGRWAGYVFVKLMLSDEEQRMSRDASLAIMLKIAEAGAEAASLAYGLHIGECGVCGRTLTNDDSRARGIGPKCAANLGW